MPISGRYLNSLLSNLVCNTATNIPFYFEAISSIFLHAHKSKFWQFLTSECACAMKEVDVGNFARSGLSPTQM